MTDQPLWARAALSGLLGAILLIALSESLRWVAIKETKASQPAPATTPPDRAVAPAASETPGTIRPEVSQAQFAELTRLSTLIGRDENELRETFDFTKTLQKNIAVQKIRVEFRNAGRQGFLYTNYTEGDGTWIFNAMEGKFRTTPSGVQVDEGPRDVCFLVTTAKYQSAQRELAGFINSPLVPESVKAPLRDFKNIVDKNYERMDYTLDKFMKLGDDFFLKSQEYGGQYYGVIQSDYFRSSFESLKPKSDEVVQQIAKYLRTN